MLILFFAFTGVSGQVVKSFDCARMYEDSVSIAYSIRIGFDQRLPSDSTLPIVKTEVERRLHVKPGKIVRIDASIAKQYKSYNYKVQVAK